MLASRIKALAAEHAPRFAVAVRKQAGNVVVMLEHPASIGAALVLGSLDDLSEERFVHWMHENPEIRRIQQAPEPVPHPELCLRIYNAFQALGWDDATLVEVTGMLLDTGAISEDERNWLRTTSGAY